MLCAYAQIILYFSTYTDFAVFLPSLSFSLPFLLEISKFLSRVSRRKMKSYSVTQYVNKRQNRDVERVEQEEDCAEQISFPMCISRVASSGRCRLYDRAGDCGIKSVNASDRAKRKFSPASTSGGLSL